MWAGQLGVPAFEYSAMLQGVNLHPTRIPASSQPFYKVPHLPGYPKNLNAESVQDHCGQLSPLLLQDELVAERESNALCLRPARHGNTLRRLPITQHTFVTTRDRHPPRVYTCFSVHGSIIEKTEHKDQAKRY